MKQKTILITGATSGIGKETAKELASLGATIVFTSRDQKRGDDVRKELVEETGNEKIFSEYCDLASFDSIRDFCKNFLQNYDRLDVLINNAGTWNKSKKLSKDGIEMTFAVNHLAPFLMTNLLLERIKESAPARIITLSSALHFSAKSPFEHTEDERAFKGMQAYNDSKLANVLFTKELARKLEGTRVTANAIMPGFIATGLFRDNNIFLKKFISFIAKSPKKGAETSVYLASSPEVENISGKYFEKKAEKTSSPASYDKTLASELWKKSEEYTKEYL
jgi:NAD(P)-dependent dehydrogenase (short-subunit alcohol dehydrogenase family)